MTSSPTLVASLPEDRRDEATGHELRSRDDAVDLLDDLEQAAATATGATPTATQPQQRNAAQQHSSKATTRSAGRRRRRRAGGPKEEAVRRGRMTARNRELFALIPVALLVSAGFAAVFAVRSDEIATLSLTYGGYFLAICVATHLFLRVSAPELRPLPVPALRGPRRGRARDALPDRGEPGRRAGDVLPPRASPRSPRRSSSFATTTSSSATAT